MEDWFQWIRHIRSHRLNSLEKFFIKKPLARSARRTWIPRMLFVSICAFVIWLNNTFTALIVNSWQVKLMCSHITFSRITIWTRLFVKSMTNVNTTMCVSTPSRSFRLVMNWHITFQEIRITSGKHLTRRVKIILSNRMELSNNPHYDYLLNNNFPYIQWL